MLPPILRIRFWRPVALPICSLRNVPTASVVKGTKMQPTAKTGDNVWARRCSTCVICRLNRHQQKTGRAPAAAKPSPASMRGSTRPTSAPTTKTARPTRRLRAELTRKPGVKRGITQQRLEKQRLQCDQRIKHHAKQPKQAAAHGEVPVLENVQIHERMVGGKFAHDKSDEGHDADDGKPAQPDGGKPVRVLPLVEDDLQCSKKQRHQAKADPSMRPGRLGANVRRVFHQPATSEKTQGCPRAD